MARRNRLRKRQSANLALRKSTQFMRRQHSKQNALLSIRPHFDNRHNSPKGPFSFRRKKCDWNVITLEIFGNAFHYSFGIEKRHCITQRSVSLQKPCHSCLVIDVKRGWIRRLPSIFRHFCQRWRINCADNSTMAGAYCRWAFTDSHDIIQGQP